MDREKQIEEIDELTTVLYEANHKKSVLDYHWLATEAYNAGYRKESKNYIEAQPIADVVQVVRCKDCKYFSEIQHCGVLGFCEPNEYCSRGERRKEDDKTRTD